MFSRFYNLCKDHFLIIILATILTSIVIGPVIAFPFVAKDNYRGINIAHFGTDSHFYLSRAKEIAEGNPLGNSFLKEGKNVTDRYFQYGEKILIKPMVWFGITKKFDIVAIYNFYNIIGVFILILLAYGFVYQLSKNKLLSATAAVFAIGGYHIVYNKNLFFNDFIIYGRAMFPYVASVFFFLYLNIFVKAIQKRTYLWIFLSGASFGLLFYIYFFAWSYALAFQGVLFLIYLFKKDYRGMFVVGSISILGVLVGLYNLIEQIKFFSSEEGKQGLYFQWSTKTRAPIFSKIGAGALFLFFIYVWKKRYCWQTGVVFSLIMAGWIALNQQVITGRTVEIGHYYWYFIVPISILIGWFIFLEIFSDKKWLKFFLSGVIVIIFVHASVGQYRSFFVTLNDKLDDQKYSPIIEKLNEINDSKVILSASDNRSLLFTIYTKHNLFWHQAATQTITPVDRFYDVLFLYAVIDGKERIAFEKDFVGHVNSFMLEPKYESKINRLYGNIEGLTSGMDYYAYENKKKNIDLIGDHRAKIVGDLSKIYYENWMSNNYENINSILKKYSVEYIVWDKNINPDWDLSIIRNIEEVYNENDIFLYHIKYE